MRAPQLLQIKLNSFPFGVEAKSPELETKDPTII
jgi:hypothetical protein